MRVALKMLLKQLACLYVFLSNSTRTCLFIHIARIRERGEGKTKGVILCVDGWLVGRTMNILNNMKQVAD